MGEVSFRGAQRLSNPQGAASPDITLQRAERIEPLGPFDSLAQTLGYGNAEQLVNNLPIAGMTNLFPKNLQRLLSGELVEKAVSRYSSQFPKVTQALTDMLTSPRHEAISSTLSDAGDIDKYLGMYSPAITTGTMHRIMQRDPVILGPSSQLLTDEGLGREAQSYGGRLKLNFERLENEPIAETYKTIRHELSHAADDLAGKRIGPYPGVEDPRYWVNTEEVRARASEPNYVRDMTGKAGPRSIINYSQLKEPAKWSQRPSYVDKIIAEINRGKSIAESKIGNPESLNYNNMVYLHNKDVNPELSTTASHYFGPNVTEKELLHPRSTKKIVEPPRLTIPRTSTSPLRPSYDWERLIKPNYERAPQSASDRAMADLLERLRGTTSEMGSARPPKKGPAFEGPNLFKDSPGEGLGTNVPFGNQWEQSIEEAKILGIDYTSYSNLDELQWDITRKTAQETIRTGKNPLLGPSSKQ